MHTYSSQVHVFLLQQKYLHFQNERKSWYSEFNLCFRVVEYLQYSHKTPQNSTDHRLHTVFIALLKHSIKTEYIRVNELTGITRKQNKFNLKHLTLKTSTSPVHANQLTQYMFLLSEESAYKNWRHTGMPKHKNGIPKGKQYWIFS